MTELDFFGMFDFSTGDTDTYQYTSAEFASLIEGLAGNGVSANVGDEFATTNSGLELTIGNGTCFIKGRFAYNDSSEVISLDAESASLQRVDRLVLELDTVNRKIGFNVVKGTAAGSAVAPDLTQGALTYQIPLYRALITNGSTVTLTDERELTYSALEVATQINAILTALDNKADADHTHTGTYAPLSHTHYIKYN